MCKIAIVTVGYSRVIPLKRLLCSVESAYYDSDDIDLYISIDNSGSDAVQSMADNFIWTHGKKTVLTYPERLGLRKHILKCGDLLENYDAIIILEDDIVVSEWFYQYAQKTVDFYHDDNRIAGISLYNYQWNENVNFPFSADISEYSTYFIQTAQSWGQIWMKNQWKDFIRWYKVEEKLPFDDSRIPKNVSEWKETSWKKYHIKYCIFNNKYFIQPYISFATCFSEVGEHCKIPNSMLQVPLYRGKTLDVLFPKFGDNKAVYYDAFFERNFSYSLFWVNDEINIDNVCIDLYASKRHCEGRRYLITTKCLHYKILKQYGLQLKPQEENVIQNIEGSEIFLYDTTIDVHNSIDTTVQVFRYHFNLYDHTKMILNCAVDTVKKRLGI